MSVLTVGTVFDLKPVGTGDVFTGLGFVATVAGVVWAAFTLRSTQRTTKGQFLLDLAPPFRDTTISMFVCDEAAIGGRKAMPGRPTEIGRSWSSTWACSSGCGF